MQAIIAPSTFTFPALNAALLPSPTPHASHLVVENQHFHKKHDESNTFVIVSNRVNFEVQVRLSKPNGMTDTSLDGKTVRAFLYFAGNEEQKVSQTHDDRPNIQHAFATLRCGVAAFPFMRITPLSSQHNNRLFCIHFVLDELPHLIAKSTPIQVVSKTQRWKGSHLSPYVEDEASSVKTHKKPLLPDSMQHAADKLLDLSSKRAA